MNDGPSHATQDIVVDEIFPHAPETIWRTLTSGALMARWLKPPVGFEPVIGNRFTYSTTPAGAWDGTIRCEVLDIVSNARFVYAWRSGHDGNVGYGAPLDTVVTFTLDRVDGGTRLRLVHSGFRVPTNEAAHRSMGGGWPQVVARIGAISGETPARSVVPPAEWQAALADMLAKEKAHTRARDALAAQRRRMPWMAVDTPYRFDGPDGPLGLPDLFHGRRQLVLYRAFFEPGVFGWPDQACRGCSLGADQVSHLAHLNARDTTLAYVSRAPQPDIARLKARMGWTMPWYTITDSFDADFGVDQWHGHNVFIRDGGQVFRTYFVNNRGDESLGTVWSYLDLTPLGRQEAWEDSPPGTPQGPPYKWWNWHGDYAVGAAPDPTWVAVSDAGQAAFRNQA